MQTRPGSARALSARFVSCLGPLSELTDEPRVCVWLDRVSQRHRRGRRAPPRCMDIAFFSRIRACALHPWRESMAGTDVAVLGDGSRVAVRPAARCRARREPAALSGAARRDMLRPSATDAAVGGACCERQSSTRTRAELPVRLSDSAACAKNGAGPAARCSRRFRQAHEMFRLLDKCKTAREPRKNRLLSTFM